MGSLAAPPAPAAEEDIKKGVPYDHLAVGVVKESTTGERRCVCVLCVVVVVVVVCTNNGGPFSPMYLRPGC